jgi:hypothetical protein
MMDTDEQFCAGCGMPQGDWEGNDGQGYTLGGESYCCRGCADGTGCTCGVAANIGN